ncbi:hypothetical protein MKY42_13490 [Paenibacillus sp. FSL W7-1088]|uniref:hypothetical protein n=1 Tax=Paenibacillus sp. FSL W7-1088 TaxID=2921695 RepID=UPI0030ED35D8
MIIYKLKWEEVGCEAIKGRFDKDNQSDELFIVLEEEQLINFKDYNEKGHMIWGENEDFVFLSMLSQFKMAFTV